MSDPTELPRAPVWLWAAVDLASLPLLLVGAAGAVAGWEGAAWLLVAAVAVGTCGHLAVAGAAYRRVMRRPWPTVPPLQDDDD